MARYKQPRQINVVSLLFFLVVSGGVYVAVMFGPHYWRSWKVKEALGYAASEYIGRRGQNLYDLRYKTEQRVRATGIGDPAVRVWFEVTPGKVTAVADYKEVVRHPLVNKVTILRFQPSTSREMSRRYP